MPDPVSIVVSDGKSRQLTNLHLQPLLHGSSTFEICGGGLDVPGNLLLGQINHFA
jgi:hypothetical protein